VKRLLLALSLALVTVASSAQQVHLPDFGSSAGGILSPEEEERIGRDMMRQLRGYNYLLDDPQTTKAAAKIWHKQVALVQELKTRFDALGPPPDGEETTVGDFRSDIAQALKPGKQIATALDKGDDPTVLVGDYTELIDASNATAGLIGFKVCGQV
jgi:hypothetical protein